MDKAFVRKVRGRPAHLREADEAYARAEEHRGKARHKQAAKEYEHAADRYRLGGLGLLARRGYVAAAGAYQHVEDSDASQRCTLRAKSLPVYWDESYDATGSG